MLTLQQHPWAIFAIPVFFLIFRRLSQWFQDRGKLPLPPKPAGLPIVGNMFDVLKSTNSGLQHLLFEKYAREHGDVVRVQVGPFTQYFINSEMAAKELFDKQSAATSERPRWIVSNEQICNEQNVLLLPASNPRWKHQRKVIHTGMTGIPRADAGVQFLHFETTKFLQEVASTPSVAGNSHKLFNSIGRYTYSAFASQTFGMEIPNADNPVIDYIFRSGLDQILGTLPGYHIVDMLPILDRLPLFLKPWETKARALFKDNTSWCNERLRRTKTAIEKGTAQNAFLTKVLQDEKKLGFETDEEAAYLSLMLIMGAADTSRMSTWSFLEAMMRFPEVQEKARREIEAVVGDRLPMYEDLEQIPYVRYMMKETWRWRPPVALGHPHTTTREIVYNGMRLPKGARIHLNAWAIQHDPDRHQDPERFWPERYEGDLTTTMQSMNGDVKNRDHFAFGSGRRVCPGYHVAERSLAIAIMRILWAFDVVPAPNAKLPLDPKDYPGEMPGNPSEDMPVMLRVRNEKKRAIIDETFRLECANRPAMNSL